MSDEVQDGVEVTEDQTKAEADAIAAAMVGYKARSKQTLPADDNQESQPVQQQAQEATDTEVTTPEDEEQTQVEAKVPTLEEKLAALKQEVMQAAGDPAAVRKLHGDIGDINRRLKELETKPKAEQAPVDDELTAALKEAEKLEDDFPEVAGPILKAIKLLSNQRQDKSDKSPVLGEEQIAAAVAKQREKDAIEALADEHPDYETVRDTAEFKAWFASKPAEYQQRVENTWNPAIVSKSLSEFKDSQAKKQKKQDRLASAITPQSVPAPAKPSAIPDEEGFMRGYNKIKKQSFKR